MIEQAVLRHGNGERLIPRLLINSSSLALEASVVGLAERYGRGKTSHTMQVWWARRPHSAMRAVTFSSLAKDGVEMPRLMEGLLAAKSYTDPIFDEAKEEIGWKGSSPTVLDFFGGGGTIPFEAAALGAKVIASDYNPLSVFVQYVNLVLPQQAFAKHGKKKALEILNESGKQVLQSTKVRTEELYPLRSAQPDKRPFGYFWTYSKECAECGTKFSLQKRPWLSKKSGKTVAVIHQAGRDSVQWSMSDKGDTAPTNWIGRRGAVCCPHCQSEFDHLRIGDCQDDLAALGILQKPTGKSFEPADIEEAYPDAKIRETHEALVRRLGGLPTTRLPVWSGIVNPSLYGMDNHADVLNMRQRTVLMTVIEEIQLVGSRVEKEYSKEMSDFVSGALAGLIDQVVDWNCRLSMWIPQNEQVGRAFCGPGIAMLWDYAETDQLLNGPANLWDKLIRIVRAVQEMPEFDHTPEVRRAPAQSTGLPDQSVDAVITDPPYYDNMFYNTLADFFYVWKKIAFRDRFPQFFELGQSEEENELVASTKRRGSADLAHQWYCRELTKALQEAKRVLKDDGVISFVYGHSSTAGWIAVAEAFRGAGLRISSVQPLSIERRARPRAMTSEAVNTCIVLVAQKAEHSAHPISLGEDIGHHLEPLGWAPEDAGMANFAYEVARQINRDGDWSQTQARAELVEVARQLAEQHPGFKMTDRKPI